MGAAGTLGSARARHQFPFLGTKEPIPCSILQPGSRSTIPARPRLREGSQGAPRDQICGKSWDLGFFNSWAQVWGCFPAHPSRLQGNPGRRSSGGSGQGRLFPAGSPGDGFAGFWEAWAEPNLTPLSPPRSPPRWKQLQHPKNPRSLPGERRERPPKPPTALEHWEWARGSRSRSWFGLGGAGSELPEELPGL